MDYMQSVASAVRSLAKAHRCRSILYLEWLQGVAYIRSRVDHLIVPLKHHWFLERL
jgi:hypothetical protein